MFCNTSEGNKDIYIGSDKMLDDLNGEYCGHKRNQNESYIRTYKVLQSHIYNNNKEYNEVLLENIDGKTGKAIIKNTFNLVPGHMYYFYFVTFDEFYDSIENIFLNSILIKIKELEKYSDKNDWINEKIVISNKLKNNAELNELENVRMDIIDDTLTNTSAKIRITDYTDHKYIYGTEYRIDKKIDNKWYKLEPKTPQYFNSMAYIPDKNGHLEFDIYWGNTYGKLSKGKYRIVKYALIDKGKCNPKCNHYYFSVEFNIN